MTGKNAVKYLEEAPDTGDVRVPNRLHALCEALGLSLDEESNAGASGGVLRFSPTRIGRVCAGMTAAVLCASDYSVGVFDPGAPGDVRSRISLDGEPISREAFVRGVERIADAIRTVTPKLTSQVPDASTTRKQRPALLHAHPFSRSELWFMLAWLCFSEAGCSFRILVRSADAPKDPVLAVTPVRLEVIAGIADRDGMTPTAACTDACAGIKTGAKEAVGMALETAQFRHVTDACSRVGIRFSVPLRSELRIAGQNLHRTNFSYRGKEGFRIRGGAEVRLSAALCAIEVCFALRRAGTLIPHEKMVQGLASLPCDGLLEPVSLEPDVIFDVLSERGDARVTLLDLLRQRSPEGRFWLIADAAFLPDLRVALAKIPAACQPGTLFCCGNVAKDDEYPGIPDPARLSGSENAAGADGGGAIEDEQEPIDPLSVEKVENLVYDRAPAAILADFLRDSRPEDLLLVMGGAAFVAEVKRVLREKM